MKLQIFDGGLSTRLAPQLVKQNQGVVYSNVDNATGVLESVKDSVLDIIKAATYPYYFNAKNDWIFSASDVDFLEVGNLVYKSDGINRPTKLEVDGTESFLGIEPPVSKPTLTANTGAGGSARPGPMVVPNNATVVNGTGGDLPSGVLKYRIYGFTNTFPPVGSFDNDFYSSALEIEVDSTTRIFDADFVPNSQNIKPNEKPTFGGDYYKDQDQLKVTVLGATKPTINFNTTTTRSVTFSDLSDEDVGLFNGFILYRYHKNGWYPVAESKVFPYTLVDNVYDLPVFNLDHPLDEDKVSPFLGTYSYVYTYYNSKLGIESAPSPVSDDLSVSGASSVTMSKVASTDPQVDFIRVYRVGGNIGEFTLVSTTANTTGNFVDSVTDINLEGSLLESDNYREAPTGLQYLTEAYDVLFGALGRTLYFTPIGVPDAWPPEFSINFDMDITGIAACANGVLVMTLDKTYLVTGTGPTTFTRQALRGDQGCIAFRSIQQVAQGAVVWASRDGLCVSNGGEPIVITKRMLGDIKLNPARSIVVDEVYYLLEDSGSILAWDYRFENIFKRLELSTTNLLRKDGSLYGDNGTNIIKLLSSSNLLPFEYKSPRYTDGSLTESKTYKKVYIRYEGDIILKVLIDDIQVANIMFSGAGTEEMQIPQELQRGYYIQFDISGTGTVSELQYDAGRPHAK